jgi:hypothetical protein
MLDFLCERTHAVTSDDSASIGDDEGGATTSVAPGEVLDVAAQHSTCMSNLTMDVNTNANRLATLFARPVAAMRSISELRS